MLTMLSSVEEEWLFKKLLFFRYGAAEMARLFVNWICDSIFRVPTNYF